MDDGILRNQLQYVGNDEVDEYVQVESRLRSESGYDDVCEEVRCSVPSVYVCGDDHCPFQLKLQSVGGDDHCLFQWMLRSVGGGVGCRG